MAAVIVSVASISAVHVGVGTHLHLRTNRAIIIQPRHTCSYAASTAASIASVYLFRQKLLLRLVHAIHCDLHCIDYCRELKHMKSEFVITADAVFIGSQHELCMNTLGHDQ